MKNNLMKTVEDVMRKVNTNTELIRKTLVFKDSITGQLDYRVAYFKHNFEADIWESTMDSTYHTIEHTIYTDIIVMTDPRSVIIMKG